MRTLAKLSDITKTDFNLSDKTSAIACKIGLRVSRQTLGGMAALPPTSSRYLPDKYLCFLENRVKNLQCIYPDLFRVFLARLRDFF